MKTTITVGAFALSALAAMAQQSDKRPNIIFILSDDHATQAISAYGHPISSLAPTPNIDRIAGNGAIFRSNYCRDRAGQASLPASTVTRTASWLTGTKRSTAHNRHCRRYCRRTAMRQR